MKCPQVCKQSQRASSIPYILSKILQFPSDLTAISDTSDWFIIDFIAVSWLLIGELVNYQWVGLIASISWSNDAFSWSDRTAVTPFFNLNNSAVNLSDAGWLLFIGGNNWWNWFAIGSSPLRVAVCGYFSLCSLFTQRPQWITIENCVFPIALPLSFIRSFPQATISSAVKTGQEFIWYLRPTFTARALIKIVNLNYEIISEL